MKHAVNTIPRGCIAVALIMLALAGAAHAGAPEKEPELTLFLVDGSCVIGTPVTATTMVLRTEFGPVRIPWLRIDRATRAEDGKNWALELQNGDLAEGLPVLAQIELQTLFGKVAVATNHITEIGVGVAGATNALGRIAKRKFVLHYPFDGEEDQIEDRSGGKNHGINHGATRVDDGVVGGALSVDGRASHLDLGSGSVAGLPTWENYTISVWFLNDSEGDQNRGYGQKIIDKTVMYHDFYLCLRSTGALAFFTYEGGGGEGLQDDSQDYRDGKWHHAVVVKKGTHGELWIDGRLKDSNKKLKQVNSNGPLLVGYSNSPDGFQKKHWSGRLDELLIFKRPLAAQEIRKLFTHRK